MLIGGSCMNKKDNEKSKEKLSKESLKDKKELKEISLKLGDKKFNCQVESFCQTL